MLGVSEGGAEIGDDLDCAGGRAAGGTDDGGEGGAERLAGSAEIAEDDAELGACGGFGEGGLIELSGDGVGEGLDGSLDEIAEIVGEGVVEIRDVR